jgi:hypothetical protein
MDLEQGTSAHATETTMALSEHRHTSPLSLRDENKT